MRAVQRPGWVRGADEDITAGRPVEEFSHVFTDHHRCDLGDLRRPHHLFGHLLRLPPAFFADRRTGELTSRLGTDVSMLQGVLTMHSTELLRQVLMLVGAVVMLTVTHIYLTLVTLVVVPIVVGTAFYFGKRLREHHMRHHFQDHSAGYGVSSPLWDHVFRTYPKKRSKYRS